MSATCLQILELWYFKKCVCYGGEKNKIKKKKYVCSPCNENKTVLNAHLEVFLCTVFPCNLIGVLFH